jgi:hypothetical protein
MLPLSGNLIKMRGMRNITALLLVFAFFVVGTGQTTKRQTQNVGSKVTTKTQKAKGKYTTKPKTLSKIRPKVKTVPKATTIEATTKDGKAITLKSNGTWEYTKVEPVVKSTPVPTDKVAKLLLGEKPAPTKTPKSAVEPMPKPFVKSTPTPAPVANPVVKTMPVAAAVKPTPAVVKTKPSPMPTQCDLTLEDAPVIRGLKLGMARSDADRIIPLDRVTILDSPDIRAYPKPGGAGSFENVSQVTARFVEDKLHGLEIEYSEDAVKWKNARDFAENLSANLNLPARFWKYNAKNPVLSEMQCREFLIKINSSINEIAVEKLTAAQKNESENQNQEKVFKP